MSNSKSLQTDAGSIAFEGLYDPAGHQFVAKEAATVGNDSGNLYAPTAVAAADGAIATLGSTTDAVGASSVIGQVKRLNPATANTALSSAPAQTTADADTSLTFSSQVNHWCVQNNSNEIVYFNLDAAASTSTFTLAPGGIIWWDWPMTTLHVFTVTAVNVNGANGIVLIGRV